MSGRFILYDKDHSRYDVWDTPERQAKLKAEYEKQQKGETCYSGILKVYCAYCWGTFYTRNSKRKYCSYRCVNDAYMERRKERKQAERRKICRVCGKHFTGKSKATIYCSDACKQKAYRQRRYENKLTQI